MRLIKSVHRISFIQSPKTLDSYFTTKMNKHESPSSRFIRRVVYSDRWDKDTDGVAIYFSTNSDEWKLRKEDNARTESWRLVLFGQRTLMFGDIKPRIAQDPTDILSLLQNSVSTSASDNGPDQSFSPLQFRQSSFIGFKAAHLLVTSLQANSVLESPPLSDVD